MSLNQQQQQHQQQQQAAALADLAAMFPSLFMTSQQQQQQQAQSQLLSNSNVNELAQSLLLNSGGSGNDLNFNDPLVASLASSLFMQMQQQQQQQQAAAAAALTNSNDLNVWSKILSDPSLLNTLTSMPQTSSSTNSNSQASKTFNTSNGNSKNAQAKMSTSAANNNGNGTSRKNTNGTVSASSNKLPPTKEPQHHQQNKASKSAYANNNSNNAAASQDQMNQSQYLLLQQQYLAQLASTPSVSKLFGNNQNTSNMSEDDKKIMEFMMNFNQQQQQQQQQNSNKKSSMPTTSKKVQNTQQSNDKNNLGSHSNTSQHSKQKPQQHQPLQQHQNKSNNLQRQQHQQPNQKQIQNEQRQQLNENNPNNQNRKAQAKHNSPFSITDIIKEANSGVNETNSNSTNRTTNSANNKMNTQRKSTSNAVSNEYDAVLNDLNTLIAAQQRQQSKQSKQQQQLQQPKDEQAVINEYLSQLIAATGSSFNNNQDQLNLFMSLLPNINQNQQQKASATASSQPSSSSIQMEGLMSTLLAQYSDLLQQTGNTNNNNNNKSQQQLYIDLLMQQQQQQQQFNQPQQNQKINHLQSKASSQNNKSSNNNNNDNNSKASSNFNNGHHQQQNNNQTQAKNTNNNINTNGNSNEMLVEINEAKIKQPLKFGWRRETTVKEISKNGIKGDVVYFSPCSKKLRTFQEIERYLTKNAKELSQKNIRLTRENFTFSSKLIVGTFLELKEEFTNIDNLEDLNQLPKEIKFNTLNEEDIIAKICHLNPKFKKKTTAFSSNNEYDGIGNNSVNIQITDSNNKPQQNAIKMEEEEQETNSNLKDKIDALKRLKQEQQKQFRNQQMQMQIQHCLEQKQHEQQLMMQFQKNADLLTLPLVKQQKHQIKMEQNLNKMNKKQEMLQQKQQQELEQQRLRLEMIEVKKREKHIQRERRIREKWFEYIMSREKQQATYVPSSVVAATKSLLMLDNGGDLDKQTPTPNTYTIPFDSIDDMQEKCLMTMPEFTPLYIECPNQSDCEDQTLMNIDWTGDALQVIEFMNVFGDKIKESLCSDDDEQSLANIESTYQYQNIISNIEFFRLGIENKNDKYKKEVIQLVQLLIKVSINNKSFNKASCLMHRNNNLDDDEDEDGQTGDKTSSQSSSAHSSRTHSPSSTRSGSVSPMSPSAASTTSSHHTMTSFSNSMLNENSTLSKKKLQIKLEEYENHQIYKLNSLELSDLTYSELIRLFIKRSYNELRIRRKNFKFQVDVTKSLLDRLKLMNDCLLQKPFDLIHPSLKVNIMAFLCDELLNAANLDLTSNITANLNTNANNNEEKDDNSDEENDQEDADNTNEEDEEDDSRIGVLVKDLDETIEELNEFKHEKWQLESKTRSLKMEKSTLTVTMNKEINAILTKYKSEQQAGQQDETKKNSNMDKEIEAEREKYQKQFQQFDKKIAQVELKKTQLKKNYDTCLNKLRSANHLGQDRFMRHYWNLSFSGGIFVEAASSAGPGSMYFSDDSTLLIKSSNDEFEEDEPCDKFVISGLISEIITKVEENLGIKEELLDVNPNDLIDDENENEIVKRYGYLIERISTDDPFQFQLRLNDPELLHLSFRKLEILIKSQIQFKQPQKINTKFLNSHHKSTSNKWWFCDTETMFKHLLDCLSKRGYREKLLSKSLVKLSEDNYAISSSHNPSESLAASIMSIASNDPNAAPNTMSVVNSRFNNNLGNLKMFEKMIQLYKDYVANLQKEKSSNQAICSKYNFYEPKVQFKLFISQNRNKQAEYKDKMKLLKQIYALEDKIINANLQQPSHSLSSKHDKEDLKDNVENVDPLLLAKKRLLALEKRIERRYLKHPFAPRKKLTLLKMNTDNNEDTDTKALPSLSSLSKSSPNKTNSEMLIEAIRKNSQSIVQNIENVPKELERWRRLVANAKTLPQLTLSFIELNKYIAWDKSIMKVICQICNCDDNEDKLLLCDNCDCGNHTYCFKPVLKTIPEGDWYCFICIGKFLNGEKLCCVCGSSASQCPFSSETKSNSLANANDLHNCHKCNKTFHGQCMPNARYFKTTSRWHCLNCQSNKSKLNLKNMQAVNSIDKTEAAQNNTSKRASLTSSKKANKSANTSKDLTVSGKKRKLNGNSDHIDSNVSSPSVPAPKTNRKSPATANKTSKKTKNKASNDDQTVTDLSENDEQSDHDNNDDDGENTNGSEAEKNDESKSNKRKKTNEASTTNKKFKKEVNKKPTPSASSLPSTQKNNTFTEKEMNQCRTLLTEMMRNEHAQPFLEKVSEQDYPDYYELIKEPMDLMTIKNKLKLKQYENKEQFAYDCRLIFDNCEYFNEDDSKIGQTGHKLRAYFETKWLKLFD